MSDLDPQTRDLRAALRATEPGARRETGPHPSPVMMVIVVALIAIAAFAWYDRAKLLPYLRQAPAAHAATMAPASGG